MGGRLQSHSESVDAGSRRVTGWRRSAESARPVAIRWQHTHEMSIAEERRSHARITCGCDMAAE